MVAVGTARAATQSPFISRATHHVGGKFREGFFVASPEVAGFVPTGDWQSVALEIALGLVTTKIEWSRAQLRMRDSPHLAEDLRALTAENGGFMLDDGWVRSRMYVFGKRLVMLHQDGEVVRVNEPPAACLARWREVVPSKRAPVVAIAGLGAWAASCSIAGATAWQVTGDSDYLVAGISFSVLVGIALVAVVFALRRVRSE